MDYKIKVLLPLLIVPEFALLVAFLRLDLSKTGSELPHSVGVWHGQARCRLTLLAMFFHPCQIFVMRYRILLPLFSLSFPFPLFPFFVSSISVMQEIA